MNRLLTLLLSVSLVRCGGDSPTEPMIYSGPPRTYESIAGTYVGTLVSGSQEVTLAATLSLTVTQTMATLSGSFQLAGTLANGVVRVPVRGTGTVTGTVDPGVNPSVSITLTPGVCPNAAVTWSGAFDSTNEMLTISGVANIFDSACVVFLTYEGTMVLSP